MAKTDQYYTSEKVLFQKPKGKDLIKVIVGSKRVRGEEKTYLDIRTWYMDESDNYCPGKGFAKPLTLDEMHDIAAAIQNYVDQEASSSSCS